MLEQNDMKRTFLSVIVVVSVLASPIVAREWTSRSGGSKTQAELVDVKDGNVILKKSDGSEISVPLSKLSLGDIQYINGVLKSAEEAVTGGEKGSGASAGAETKDIPPQVADMKLSPVTPEVLKKLHYDWKKGQTYTYQVRIIGERGNDTENRSGDVIYKVKSTRLGEVELGMTSNLNYTNTSIPHRVIILSGRHVRFGSDVDKPKEEIIRIDPNGKLLESRGQAPLPYLLGDLAELVVEPLSSNSESTWTVSSDPKIAVVAPQYPYYRTSRVAYREGVPAEEKTTYTVLGETGNLIVVSKHYEMTTASTLNGKPRIEATGNGVLKFDAQKGAFASLDFDIKVAVRDMNKTEDTPIHISYRLLSDQEIAELEQEKKKEKEEAETAQKEKTRPLSDEEAAIALADLTSEDNGKISAAVKKLIDKKPQKPNPAITKAIETIMLNSDNAGNRADAAKALKNWSTTESIPALIKTVNDPWVGASAGAIDTLCIYKPHDAIKPVAARLAHGNTRGAAVKFLRAVGEDAEDAVLAILEESKDAWVRAEICGMLESFGTKKSIPALEKALTDESWMVNGNARKALAAIKARNRS